MRKEIIIYFNSYRRPADHFEFLVSHIETNICLTDTGSSGFLLKGIELSRQQTFKAELNDFIVVQLLFAPLFLSKLERVTQPDLGFSL